MTAHYARKHATPLCLNPRNAPGSYHSPNSPLFPSSSPPLLSFRVMVLDAGKIVEFDSPASLFEKQGHFYAMAKDAGINYIDYTTL